MTIPVDRVREALEAQFSEVNGQISLPGFRQGKAPRRILEARFGRQIRDEVKGKLIEAAYQQAVEEKHVIPLSQPELDVDAISVEDAKPLEFSFEVITRPEFDLPTWKGLEVRVPAAHVSEADVDAGVEHLRRTEGTLETSTDPLGADDLAVLDWTIRAGDQVLAQGEGSFYRMSRGALEGLLVEGLDEALLGSAPGASATVRAHATPDDPRPALAGGEHDLEVVLREVKRFVPAPLDEAFLRRHDFDDEAEMRKDVRRRILRGVERERDHLAEERLLETLVGQVSFPLPPEWVERSVEQWRAGRRADAEAEGMEPDELKEELLASADTVRAKMESELRRYFLLERICEAEDFRVAEQEFLGALEQLARDSGRSTGELIEHFREEPGRLADLRAQLRHRKAREAIRRAAVLVEEAPPAGAK